MAITLAGGATADPEFRDADWTQTLYSNCDLPVTDITDPRASVSWSGTVDRALRVRLAPGDVGGCFSDPVPRSGAPYFERAEVRAHNDLALGARHDIRFQMRMIHGFRGAEETFFQIHGWETTCEGPPMVMLRYDRGQFQIRVLQPFGGPITRDEGRLETLDLSWGLQRELRASILIGLPLFFDARFDLRGATPSFSLAIDGFPIAENVPVHMRPCSVPHFQDGALPARRRIAIRIHRRIRRHLPDQRPVAR